MRGAGQAGGQRAAGGAPSGRSLRAGGLKSGGGGGLRLLTVAGARGWWASCSLAPQAPAPTDQRPFLAPYPLQAERQRGVHVCAAGAAGGQHRGGCRVASATRFSGGRPEASPFGSCKASQASSRLQAGCKQAASRAASRAAAGRAPHTSCTVAPPRGPARLCRRQSQRSGR